MSKKVNSHAIDLILMSEQFTDVLMPRVPQYFFSDGMKAPADPVG